MRASTLAWLSLALAAYGCKHSNASIPQRPDEVDAQVLVDAQAPGEARLTMDAGTQPPASTGSGGSSGTRAESGTSTGGGGDGARVGSGASSGAGSGGAMASGMDGGTVPASDGSVAEIHCTSAGALRCAGVGSPTRQECKNGQWVAAADCETGSVCDSTDATSPGTCKPSAQHCQGANGKPVCVGAVMHQCSVDAVETGSTPCSSERLCQQGIGSGHCPQCAIGTFECTGAQLRACKADGSGYEDSKLCGTAALCNALVGECTTAKCVPTTKVCQNDNLEKCNADQTGFVLDKMCGAGLCDMANGQCDLCFPGAKDCSNNTPRTCSSDGQAYTPGSPCTGATDICSGGACIECLSATDCSTTNPCLRATCNTGNGNCGTAFLSPHAPCNAGVCDGVGNCIECVDNTDCTGTKNYCSAGHCVACLATANCTQPTNPCKQTECSGNSCVASNKDDTATCNSDGGKVCDGAGNCVRCNVNSDCGGGFCTGHQCMQCRSPADCSGSVCAPATCVNGTCGTTPLDGNSCGANKVCNKGTCQTACGNGRVDTSIAPAEECDPGATNLYNWYNCDPATCQSRTYYTVCSVDGNCDHNCWNETNSSLYFCGPACSVDADCPKLPFTNSDRVFCAQGSCAIDCTNGNDASCPPHLKCLRSGPIGACVKR